MLKSTHLPKSSSCESKISSSLHSSKKKMHIKSSINIRSSCQEYFAEGKNPLSSYCTIQKSHSHKKTRKHPHIVMNTSLKNSGFHIRKERSQKMGKIQKMSAGKQTTRQSASELKSHSPHTSRNKTIKMCKSSRNLKQKLSEQTMQCSESLKKKSLEAVYERTRKVLRKYEKEMCKLRTDNERLQQENTSLKRKVRIN